MLTRLRSLRLRSGIVSKTGTCLNRIDRLFEALRINSLLWSIFQAQISAEENPLPRQLREDLLTLSFFVDKRTREVMCFPEPDKLTALININLNIAAGLKEAAA